MNIRGLNYDLARSRRADLPHLKAVIDRLADLSYTLLSLYLEHRFDFPSAPGLAPPGSLTTGMARELTAYGRTRGIQVVPQINLLGHCEGIGAVERYAALTCDPCQQLPWGGYEQLNLEREETKTFVREAVADICAAFPDSPVHIGGDEVRQMAWLFPGDPARQEEAILAWLHFLVGEVKGRGRRVLMWGDMLLRHDTLLKRMPRDVVVCDWHYGPAGSRETLTRLRDEGFPVLAAPAVSSCSGFGVQVSNSLRNIAAMVGDAADLGLEGFLLATWEFGFGSGPDLIWPFVSYAAALAAGTRPASPEDLIAGYGSARFGVDGAAYLRLHAVLDSELETALRQDLPSRPWLLLVNPRKALFRGASPFPDLARPGPVPANHHQQVWEPGPFGCWLFLRPIITPALLDRLTALAAEGSALADRLRRQVEEHADELESLLGLAEALAVMAENLRLLEKARGCYHEAALAQAGDHTLFRTRLDEAARHLEGLRPGLLRLRKVVAKLDRTCGLDAGEHAWLTIQEKSLREHVRALRRREPDSDSLLEFGDFLRRPAHVTPRLTWR